MPKLMHDYVMAPLYVLLSIICPRGPLGEVIAVGVVILLTSLASYLVIWFLLFILRKLKDPLAEGKKN